MAIKNIVNITVADIKEYPVWRFVTKSNGDLMSVSPVKRLPTTTLVGKVVGVQVTLADGGKVWALLGNVDVSNARLTEHFLTASFEREGQWFHLARYHDFDYDTRGPTALASFLAKNVGDVFPMKYDIRPYATGDELALSGEIRKEPQERLSREDVIALAVP